MVSTVRSFVIPVVLPRAVPLGLVSGVAGRDERDDLSVGVAFAMFSSRELPHDPHAPERSGAGAGARSGFSADFAITCD